MAFTPRTRERPPDRAQLIEDNKTWNGLYKVETPEDTWKVVQFQNHHAVPGWFTVYNLTLDEPIDPHRRLNDSWFEDSTSEDEVEEPESRPQTPVTVTAPVPHTPPQQPRDLSRTPGAPTTTRILHTPRPITSNTMAAAPKEISIGKPPAFDGDRSKSGLFLQSCNNYLRINASIYNDDEKKIAFILSFMTEGTAAIWAQRVIEDALFETFHPAAAGVTAHYTTQGYGTFRNFIPLFKSTFAPIDNKEMSYLKFTQLKQADCKGGLGEYIAQFQLLAAQAEISEFHILKRQYIMGLYENLRRAFDISTTTFDNMNQIYNVANMMNDAFLRERGTRDNRKKGPFKGKYNGPKLAKLTPDERNKLAKEGRCFRCCQKGHMAAQCTNTQNYNQNFGGNNQASTSNV